MTKKKPLYLPDNGSSFCSPESIEIEEEYSITINPDEQFIGDQDRFMLFTAKTYKYLRDNLKYCSMQLFPELSGKGRLHYHGYITINDICGFYMYDVHRLIQIGHVNMDTIDIESGDTWDEYVRKQVHILKEYTETNIHYDKQGKMSLHHLRCKLKVPEEERDRAS